MRALFETKDGKVFRLSAVETDRDSITGRDKGGNTVTLSKAKVKRQRLIEERRR